MRERSVNDLARELDVADADEHRVVDGVAVDLAAAVFLRAIGRAEGIVLSLDVFGVDAERGDGLLDLRGCPGVVILCLCRICRMRGDADGNSRLVGGGICLTGAFDGERRPRRLFRRLRFLRQNEEGESESKNKEQGGISFHGRTLL